MKNLQLTLFLLIVSTFGFSQSDLVVGVSHQFNIQRQNAHADAFILHNSIYSSGNDNLKWKTVDTNFGSRGIRFSYGPGRGIYFYADNVNPVSTTTEFTPTTRFFIGNDGNVGIGTTSPSTLLQVGNSELRNVNFRLGERATFGLTYQNAETVIGNNAIVNGIDVEAMHATEGASAMIMRWVDGIHFYVTDTLVAPGMKINVGRYERLRITPDNGVFAEQVTVEAQDEWPDYVFENDYQLTDLNTLESFIKTNKHLPGIPKAAEVEATGINLGKMDAQLLEKIEQLTLYMLEQNKKIERLIEENVDLNKKIAAIQTQNKQNQ